MEAIVPLFALSSYYLINKQSNSEDKKENFYNRTELPNVNIPDKNYPNQEVVLPEADVTSKLSTTNKFNGTAGVYTDKYFQPNQKTQEPLPNSNGSQFTSLAGDKVSESYFKHDNMVPYFGGNMKGSNRDKNDNEGLIDAYTGSGSQSITKQEQSPLFAPNENLQWAHGAPNQTDFVRSRINPSQRMANVKPFQEERVAPGLGLGYTNEGSNGFNSGMMEREKWLPKTADELRVANNPKSSGVSLLGHEGPADSRIKNIATTEQMGVMEKNRPDRMFELDNRDINDTKDIGRLFVTGGAHKAQTLHSMPIQRAVTRPETTTDYTGAASHPNSAAYVPGEYMPSHNQQLGSVPMGVAGAVGKNRAGENDHSVNSKKAYPNNRTVNKQDGYFGAVRNNITATVAPLLDVLRPSRKENAIGTLRPYQNPGSTVSNSYIFNPADKMPTTIRETTENSKFHLNVNSNQNGGAYTVSEQQASDTIRQETGDFFYAGNASAGERTRQTTSYEAGYNQRNNDKKTAEGYMVKGNLSVLNTDVNMRQASRDNMLTNNREVSGNMPYRSPEASTMGQFSGQHTKNQDSKIQLDRTNPEIMNNLKANPYVVDYKTGL